MATRPQVQDEYLNEARLRKRPVEIVLLGGKSLQGIVECFDAFTIKLRCRRDEVLVFKSAIAVIGPVRARSREH
ncbi:MAG TPA: RNA chaperone Hfq [Armatimonadetes bacterium]|nr:RNA chaperone Hfq [Armatimonadota bacterium]